VIASDGTDADRSVLARENDDARDLEPLVEHHEALGYAMQDDAPVAHRHRPDGRRAFRETLRS
jgi:hypothetical protein